jgi:ketosteroid isomerase-like protein
MNHEDFVRLMTTIADSWNAGDTRRALACFTDDAVYLEPPDEQRYEGRDELFEFFGGDDPPPMHMDWHHLVVDGDTGAGEYTYRGRGQYHGIVIVRCRDGRISHWREYQYVSDLPWEEFVGPSRFS